MSGALSERRPASWPPTGKGAALRHRQYEEPKPIRRGEELGILHLGSTTIVVFEPGRVELDALAAGASVKMGVGIGRIAPTTGKSRG